MSVGELINSGPDFDKYQIYSALNGSLLDEFDDKYGVLGSYSDEYVYEWTVFSSGEGYAVGTLEITIND